MKISKQKTKLIAIFIADLIALSAGAISTIVVSATNAYSSIYFSGFLIYFSIIALFLFTVIVFVDCYAMFAIKTSTYHSFLLALCIETCCLLSPDYLSLFNLPSAYGLATNIIQYGIFMVFVSVIIIFFNFSYTLGMSKKRKLFYFFVCLFSFLLFVALYTVKWHFVSFVLILSLLVEVLRYTSRNPNIKCFNSFSFRPAQFLIFTLSGLILVNILYSSGTIDNYPFGITSFYLFTMTLTYCFIYFSFVRRTQERDFDNLKYRTQYERLKSSSLQAQIKPHFVFNVLSSIKNLYHTDPESGDYAISLFSKHLRASVEATSSDIIPFEKELNNIQIYIDLENIRRDNELNVIFNIEYSDFQIPALSLQPFIENAIKYSKIDKNEDGYLKISSLYNNGDVLLEIFDNGVGFNPDSIPQSSYGIRNSVERFRLLTGVTPEIISSVGNGTLIRIKFNKASLEKANENNNS